MSPFKTPDRRAGPRQEEELQLEDNAPDPTAAGGLRYNGDDFRLRDAAGVFNPRPGVEFAVEVSTRTDQTSSNSFETLQTFIFEGTDRWGTPTYWTVVWAATDSPAANIIVKDVTNNVVVAEASTGGAGSVPWEVLALTPYVDALPKLPAIFALQARSNFGGSNTIFVDSLVFNVFPAVTVLRDPRITLISPDSSLGDFRGQNSAQGYNDRYSHPNGSLAVVGIGNGGVANPGSITLSDTYT